MSQVRYSHYKIQNLGISGEIPKHLYHISALQFVYKIRIFVCSWHRIYCKRQAPSSFPQTGNQSDPHCQSSARESPDRLHSGDYHSGWEGASYSHQWYHQVGQHLNIFKCVLFCLPSLFDVIIQTNNYLKIVLLELELNSKYHRLLGDDIFFCLFCTIYFNS